MLLAYAFLRNGSYANILCFQVMLKASSYVAISIYGVMSLIAAVAAIMLPIETKGREMKVTLINVCVCFYGGRVC